MRTIALIAGLALFAAPAHANAQEATDVLAGLRSGGGWVRVPIQDGRGSVQTMRMPAMGMRIEGCVNVWGGHSGSWEIHATDAISDSTLVVNASPGLGVPFGHTFGMQAQMNFDFRWSEPRDTTLLLWVGLAIGKTTQEACEPVFGR